MLVLDGDDVAVGARAEERDDARVIGLELANKGRGHATHPHSTTPPPVSRE